jgi:cobalt-precorrin-5B (C1)-methyltransferase
MSEYDEESAAPPKRRGLRSGFTTGACATAAAVAATRWLLRGETPDSVTIHLPIGRDAEFRIAGRAREGGWALCSVIKDAGDDPDVTHNAEIRARVWRRAESGLLLAAGTGVGTVTRPGLGLEVGGPAINPVPRRMIAEHLETLAAPVIESEGLAVEISVPNGEELARRTLNGRLGIVGGLSILGTTGIVVPYSTAAWRASVEQAVDVAAANGQTHIVLSTGGRSEQFAQALFDLPEVAFVEMGEFTGHALRRCVQRGIRTVTLAGFIGKMSKIALGHFMTHVAGNQVDLLFLSDIGRECGASDEVVAEIRAANTARHFQEIALREGLSGVFRRLCELVCERSDSLVGGELALECIIFNFDGSILGRASSPVTAA